MAVGRGKMCVGGGDGRCTREMRLGRWCGGGTFPFPLSRLVCVCVSVCECRPAASRPGPLLVLGGCLLHLPSPHAHPSTPIHTRVRPHKHKHKRKKKEKHECPMAPGVAMRVSLFQYVAASRFLSRQQLHVRAWMYCVCVCVCAGDAVSTDIMAPGATRKPSDPCPHVDPAACCLLRFPFPFPSTRPTTAHVTWPRFHGGNASSSLRTP